MSTLVSPGTPIDLSNCAAEPIHIPGSIQPHGALLAFMPDGTLATRSVNAAMLGALPEVGGVLEPKHLSPAIQLRIRQALDGHSQGDIFDVALPDGRFADLTLHRHEGLVFAEFEPRGATRPAGEFAQIAQRALTRIQRQSGIQGLLDASAEEIALLSGFDRVMAYVFHPDDSGEIVAERMRKPLEPFLGLRYPASDLPGQGRALFVLNPIRLIVDVDYKGVPIEPDLNPLTGGHVDLSYSVLRSVSPIHCEYLSNMGVHASMAISIVVQGRLWGLFACHHYEPHLVSPAVRVTCRLLSQVVSLMVERLLAVRRAEAVQHGQNLRSAILERVRHDDYIARSLTAGSPGIRDLIPCAGAAVSSLEHLQTTGEVPEHASLQRIVAWLEQLGDANFFASACLEREDLELSEACAGFAGLLAIRYSTEGNAWAMWFRREQVLTLRWAGNPDKPVAVGPNGLRLSPRGSFSEWKQEVRGRADPWEEHERFDAEELRRSLAEVVAARLQEMVRAREMLLAMLGHDLRTPVRALASAGEILRADGNQVSAVQQIASISGRMGRLINHVLDLSRLQAGMGLSGTRQLRDFDALLDDIVSESRYAHPDCELECRYTNLGQLEIDADRVAQVLGNLISNARHHGTRGKPILLEAERGPNELHIRVINHGQPLTDAALQRLFDPFKRGSLDNAENPGGLGLGLYIASSIVAEHGGRLGVESHGERVTFTVTLPLPD